MSSNGFNYVWIMILAACIGITLCGIQKMYESLKNNSDRNPIRVCHIIGDMWKSGKVLYNTCEVWKDDLGKRLHLFICRQQIRDHDWV